MKHFFTCSLLLLSLLAGSNRALAQACTTGCNFTATSGGSYNLSGNQLLCFNASNPTVTNISGNFNGTGNQICVATGVTWNQTNSLNLSTGSFSSINVYGTTNFTGGGSFNATTINIPGSLNLAGGASVAASTITISGTTTMSGGSIGAAVVNISGSANITGVTFNSTTINVTGTGSLTLNANSNINGTTSVNVASGSTLQTNITSFPSNFSLTNSGTTTFTSSSDVAFTGTFTNAAGATITATAPSLLKFGSGATIVNAGTMNISNLENSDVNQFTNQSSGIIRVNRSFYNHGGFLNNGLVRTLCVSNSSGSAPCEFRTGDKGGKVFLNSACMIIAGAVTFDGPATLNGTLEILSGYNLTINKIVTGSNGTLLVDGGTSTIGQDGQYTGATGANAMKFYDANTTGHDFDAKNNPNTPSVYTVLSSAPVTSCSATTTCSLSVAVTAVQPTCLVPLGVLNAVSVGATSFTLTGPVTVTSTTGIFVSLNPGSYTVTASNGAGCSVVSSAVTVNVVPTAPAAPTLTVVQPTCVTSTGSLTATSTGAISYTLTNGTSNTVNTTGVFASVAPGSYTVIANNGLCNSPGSTTTINTAPTTPAAPTLTVVQPTCATSTGSLTATSAGATSYTLTSGASTSVSATGVFTNLAPGSYTVVAGNGTCSSARSTTTINTAPTTPAAPTLTVVQPTCITSTGSLTAASAGATSYTLINGGTPVINGTGIFAALAPSSYTVIASNGTCNSVGSTTTIIANPGTPAAPSLTVVQPTCITSTGSLTATSAGANSYTLTNGGTPVVNSTGIFTGIASGSYTVVAGNGTCRSANSTMTIVANPGTPTAPSLTVIQPTCITSTGSLTATSAGATSYSLTNGGTPVVNSTGIFAGIAPGSYTVTASNGTCTSTGTPITIVANPGTPAAPTLTVVQSTCTTATGSLTATSAGATSYTLTDGVTPIVNTTGIFTGLAPNSYTIIAGNSSCVSIGSTTTIIANPGTPAAPTLSVVQPTCSIPTGSITATSSGATSYTLTNGVTPIVNGIGVFASLNPGSYTVIAGNSTCTSVGSTTIIITNPGTPAAPTLTVVQPTCITSTGSLTATSAGATSYTLTNGGTPTVNATGIFTGLAPDSYTVIAGNGTCTSIGSTIDIIANPGTPITPTLTVDQPDCIIPTGSITATSTGATSYTLTNGVTPIVNSTGIFTGLASGSYTVTAGNGTCSSAASTTMVIANPGTPAAPLLVVVQPTTVTLTGSLTATSAGATSYTLSGPTAGTNMTGIFTGLVPGSYTVTAGNGSCSSPNSTTVINPSSPNITILQPSCTTPTGSVTATSTGATSFTLTNGVTPVVNTTGLFSGLAPGSYTVTAGNGISNSLEVLVVINDNPGTPAAPTLAVDQPDCTIPTGSITATSVGATSYTLINGGTPIVNATGVFTNLSPGSYTVIAGNTSCISTGSTAVIIANPGTPAAPTLTVIQPNCSTPTGSLTATSAGATSYTLTNGVTPIINATGIFTGLAPDSYTVIASNGTCTSPASTTTVITNPGTPTTPALTVIQPNCATPVGSLTATSTGATSYTLTDGVTLTVNGTGVFTSLNPGSYTVIAGNGTCTSVGTPTTIIANPGTPAAPTLTVVQPDCITSTGSLTATSAGATSYTLTDGVTPIINTTGIFTGLAPDSYTVIAGNGTCTSTGTPITIIANPGTPAVPTLSVVQPDCSIPTGSITATSSGATSFTLLNGGTPVINVTGAFTGLAPGSYTVIAGNGSCVSAGAPTTIIANPGTPAVPTLTVIQPDCITSTGSLTATSVGATSYTLISGGSPVTNSTGLFAGLTPGSYTVIASNGICISVGAPTTIIANPGTPLAPALTVIQPSCTTPTGSLTATSTGATSYSLSGPVTATNGTGLFVGLTPGSYTVTASNGTCSSVGSTTIILDAPAVPAAPTAAMASCSSATAATGSILVSSPAMGAGITYSIDGVTYQASHTFTNVAVGVYNVTVQQNGCTSLPTSVTVSECSPPMPVNLVSFAGKWIDGTGNQLSWTTSWERNNNYFEIQRSSVAKSFESIGRVTGKGTTSVLQAYQYVDSQPISDITYYRLKQVDIDGTISYSKIIAVERGIVTGINLEMYPNPTSAELNLRLKVGQTIEEVNVYDGTGHRVMHEVDGKTAVQVSRLYGGVYTIEVKTTTGQVVRQRFVKQ